jgi:O-Antigen ligase/Tetratricopeptide repeat
MMRSLATGFLLLAWLFPLLNQVGSELVELLPYLPIPYGPAVIDSNRTLLFTFCFAAFCFSHPPKWKPSVSGVWVLAFLSWTLISSLLGGTPVDSLFFSMSWLSAAMAFAAARRMMPASFSFQARFLLFHFPITVIAAAALTPVIWDSGVMRVDGPFQISNVYSNWLLIFFPLVFLDVFRTKGWPLALSLTSTVLGLASLTLTYSRTSWILTTLELCVCLLLVESITFKRWLGWALFVSAGSLLLFAVRAEIGGVFTVFSLLALLLSPALLELIARRRGPSLWRFLVIAGLSGGLVFLVVKAHPGKSLATKASTRMDNLARGDNSMRARTEFWAAAFQLSTAHPLLGTGPDTYSENYPRFQTHYYYYSDSPHCTILEMTSEIGWIGGLLFLVCLALFVKEIRRRGPITLEQRIACTGVLIGLAHAQLDVTYQFAELWTTLAFTLSFVAGPEAVETADGPWPPANGLFLVCAPFLLYLAHYQRLYESVRGLDDDQTIYTTSLAVAEKLPGWSKPNLRALESGLNLLAKETEPAPKTSLVEQLVRLTERALKFAPENASTYRMAGDLSMQQQRYEEAERRYRRALDLDPFNYPLVYNSLFELAQKRGDPSSAREWVNESLRRYPLEEFSRALPIHQDHLAHQLVVLMLNVADFLSPYRYPKETEPLYRFAVERREWARAYHGLGVSLLTQGRYNEAYPLLEKAHKLNPLYPSPENRTP